MSYASCRSIVAIKHNSTFSVYILKTFVVYNSSVDMCVGPYPNINWPLVGLPKYNSYRTTAGECSRIE